MNPDLTFDTITDDWQLVAQVSQAYRTLANSYMDSIGMHRAQAIVLCTICASEGLTQSEIAAHLSVQGATITPILKKMEEAQWITRHRDLNDNRLVRVYATERGHAKEKEINARFREFERVLFRDIPADHRTLLRELLLKLISNMNEAEG
jgi:DNA-binding MarR family transcriptional regulator